MRSINSRATRLKEDAQYSLVRRLEKMSGKQGWADIDIDAEVPRH